MEVIACDPGIVHFGMVQCIANQYVYCANHDLTRFREKQLADRVQSLLRKHEAMFSTAKAVVLETQPPGSGGDGVAQLLYQQLREKVVWVHPYALHAHFGLKGLDYDSRKVRSVELAAADLSHLPGWQHGRKHDMSDAWMMAQFHIDKVQAARQLLKTQNECRSNGFDRFRFTKRAKP